jgi:hypothetical protein
LENVILFVVFVKRQELFSEYKERLLSVNEIKVITIIRGLKRKADTVKRR